MMILYGADLSGPSNKVRFVANYIGETYEYRRVRLREGETRTPEFLRLHPAGKIPVLEDNGFTLFESNAIIRYLAEKHQSEIYPAALQERAIVNQWLDFVTQQVEDGARRIIFNRVFAPMIPLPVKETVLQEGEALLNRFLPIVENRLVQGPFLAGSALSLADFALLSALDPAEAAGIDLSSYGHLQKWRKGLSSKAFYTKCHARYEDSLGSFRQKRPQTAQG